MSEVMIGETLGHYKIVDKLGEGGMGEVYEAEDTELRRRVALKVLPTEMATDPERLERFQREARMVAALNHPNIVTIYSVEQEKVAVPGPGTQDPGQEGLVAHGTSSTVHFLTMELVDGQTLGSLIPAKGMGLDDLFNVAIPLADALVAAHDTGITHRDLKPGNVMVTGDKRVKVLDFGLAKAHDLAPEVDATHLATEAITEDGRVLGTVPYMSPEQVEGKTLDPRSDIFSMGIILYEMATGRRPFAGDSSAALMSAILRESPSSVTVLKEDLPRQMARIIAHCLEKDPDRRFQTAKDLRNELQSLSREIETGEILESSAASVSAIQAVPKRSRWPVFAGAGIAVIALLAVLGFLLMRSGDETVPGTVEVTVAPSAAVDGRTMVAVLPFENLGAAEDEYFADGLTEEITSRLAAVSGLGVISRTSAMQYKENRPALKQIGQELGVDYVLEGTVRWERPSEGPSRIRVTPQLIRVADDTHLWSERYDRELEELFAVQSSIAGEVTQALNVTLLEPEQAAIEDQPTANMEAYQAYLRGLDLWHRPGYDWEIFERAGEMFERAGELDPDFLLPWTQLVGVYGMLYSWRDKTEDRLADLERVMARAEALAPDHPQVRLAKGYYYYFGFWQYEEALQEFLAAEVALPNDAEVPEAMAYIYRRLGNWTEAANQLKRALGLDPRNAHFSSELGRTLTGLRRHEEAVEYHSQAIRLAPDSRHVYYLAAYNLVAWKGDVEGALEIIGQAPGDATEDQLFDWTTISLLSGEYEAALARLGVIAAAAEAEGEIVPWVRNFQGYFHELLGNTEASRGFYEKAIDEARQALDEAPQLAPNHAVLASAAAGLGQEELALSENQSAYQLVEKDRFWAPRFLEDRAAIYAMFEEPDQAIDLLDELLAMPYDYSITVPLLRLEPRWKPLHDHPRFQALLDKYDTATDS